jgi:hypothetical protein
LYLLFLAFSLFCWTTELLAYAFSSIAPTPFTTARFGRSLFCCSDAETFIDTISKTN